MRDRTHPVENGKKLEEGVEKGDPLLDIIEVPPSKEDVLREL